MTKASELSKYKDEIEKRLPEIDNYAALRSYSGQATAFYVRGVDTIFDGGAGIFRVKAGDTTSVDNGGTILVDAIGRRWFREIGATLNIKWFKAGQSSGSSDDTNSIKSAIGFIESLATTTTSPYQIPVLWFPFDVYVISSPIRSNQAIKMDGDNAIIRGSGPGFGSISVPLEAGGSETYRGLLLLLNGNKGSITGQTRQGASIGRGITLDCNEYAYPALYIERMPYSSINCKIFGSSQNGLEIGPYMWGINLDDIILENVTGSNIYFHANAAANGITINNPRIWGNFKTSHSGITFADGSECNGLKVSGGFIEKIDYGSLVGNTSGPISFIGVDFEQCTSGCVRAVGSVTDGRRAGPVTIQNCFLHSVSGPKIYASRSVIEVDGCRMFPSSVDFETDLNYSGAIIARNNEYPSGLNIAAGSNVTIENNTGVGAEKSNYISHKIANFTNGNAVKNFQFRDSPFLRSSGFDFYSYYVGGPTEQYVSYSDWWTSEYQHVTNPGVLNKVIGVRLANDAGQNAFQPIADNVTSCGGASARWSQVYSANGAINTSDERSKQDICELDDKERRVASACKSLIRKYRMRDAVAEKGEAARWHFGAVAQDVVAAFEAEGLDAMKYGIICYDEWTESKEITDSDGNIIRQFIPAGNRYGIRYDEFLAFVISSL
jgi:hypothetical protein